MDLEFIYEVDGRTYDCETYVDNWEELTEKEKLVQLYEAALEDVETRMHISLANVSEM